MRRRYTEIIRVLDMDLRKSRDRIVMRWLNLMVELGGGDSCIPE